MARTRQSPISGWQPADPGSQVPQPGTPFLPAGYGPARVRMPRRRKLVLATVVTAFVVIDVVIAGIVLGGKPKGSVVLPHTLLGLPKATSAGDKRLAGSLRTQEQAGAHGRLTGVVAGIYGNPTGAWLAISGGGICGNCTAKSAAAVRSNLVDSGYADAALYPAGPKGGVLACGSRPWQGGTLIRCTWVDGRTAGELLFAAGAASGPADAAAKTNQVRIATEH